ncbi:hypothetical protein Tco_0521763, partial [Tanacetum coccineum]
MIFKDQNHVPNIWVLVKIAMITCTMGISYGENNVRPSSINTRPASDMIRADNDLYRFKEGDFPRLCINDIEDMLLLVVHNRLINLSSNDVSDFALALRMFTRSLVIQKQVKDLQIGNIQIEYLPKRRWSTLEKKRANIMIKAIDKQLEERRLMRSLEKFVSGSKRRAFWSLNEDILKITTLKTNTPYPSKKIRRIRACTHQRPQKDKDQYAGFAAALAVLITRASQSRQHDMSEPIQRISLIGFPAQSVGSSNTYVSDSPCLLVLITGTSQSRQHGSRIHRFACSLLFAIVPLASAVPLLE